MVRYIYVWAFVVCLPCTRGRVHLSSPHLLTVGTGTASFFLFVPCGFVCSFLYTSLPPLHFSCRSLCSFSLEGWWGGPASAAHGIVFHCIVLRSNVLRLCPKLLNNAVVYVHLHYDFLSFFYGC